MGGCAVSAFMATIGFDTVTSFTMTCTRFTKIAGTHYSPYFKEKFMFNVEYPFKFTDQTLRPYRSCANTTDARQRTTYQNDYSFGAHFYAMTCLICAVYSMAALGLHACAGRPLWATIDMIGTIMLAIVCPVATTVWAVTVHKIRYFASPTESANPVGECYESNPGKWTMLNISQICGFVNVFLWALSVWFVYRETQSRGEQVSDQKVAPVLGAPKAWFGEQTPQLSAHKLGAGI
ncbi:unnamed protein product [Medioppia subpectinata]|uniref:Pantophysin n=1 Tax=Medioppia subpectinata TaxID=1979941 RepID=A0A7R9Q7D9_9ACAR|nr:unnamed protein product [Medioppia subpectinata]CAG2115468.1 unnamed protein product [Medioppia subpectinata]